MGRGGSEPGLVALARAAICGVGLLQRISPDKEGLRHVAQALRAEVFLVLTGPEGVEVPSHLAALAQKVKVQRDPGRVGIQRAADQFNASGAVIKVVWRMLFAQPLSMPPEEEAGTGTYQLRDMSACLAMVHQREAEQGARYEYLVYARLDALWLTTLPDLDLLRSVHPDAVWIPDGCDSDGLNDRMAIVPRRWATHYFDRWSLLLSGKLTALLLRAYGGDRLADRGAEWLLYTVLRGYRIPVLRFTPVAALVCIGGQRRHSSCTRILAIGEQNVRFRYSQEGSEVLIAADMLARGWVWRPARAPWVQPGCFSSLEEARGCCDERENGWGGRASCFNDVWYFWRCCGPGAGRSKWDTYDSIVTWRWGAEAPGGTVHGVYVLPAAETARKHAEESLAPLCYRISETASRCVDPEELARDAAWSAALAGPPPALLRRAARADGRYS